MTAPAAARWPFHRIAIVNRGEPAMRLIRAVRELDQAEGAGLRTVALFTDPDERALFVREADEAVRLGPSVTVDGRGRPASSYVDLERLERALVEARADAAWVGWGFVAERPEFAELCERLGIVFIGPSSRAMRTLGDKIASKRLARELGVPLAPWSGGPIVDIDEGLRHGERIGYPLMVKATAGGGGRGVRRVDTPAQLRAALEAARAEAGAAFGDPTLLMELLVPGARHVEVQAALDAHGGAWALGVRDCSVQRRHQKVIEESSSTALSPAREAELGQAAVRLCLSAGYVGLATVEFLLDPRTGAVSFMEVNARLQVEHPVTEATTGVDLVKLQLRLAAGERLRGEAPAAHGHAIEARLCAEDPDNDFAPAPGLIELLRLPGGPGIRVDCGVAEGDPIPTEFDSMVAKVIAWGHDRPEALARLARALQETAVVVRGGTTNRGFLLRLLAGPELRRGDVDVDWLRRSGVETAEADSDLARTALLVAAVEAAEEDLRLEKARFFATAARGRPEVSETIGRQVELSHGENVYRLTVATLAPQEYRVTGADGCAEIRVERIGSFERRAGQGGRRTRAVVARQDHGYLVDVDGLTFRLRSGGAGMVRAPAPGMVTTLLVAPGDTVEAGAPVAVIEAMKMESSVLAPVSGTVSRLLTGANRQVAAGAPLLEIEPERGPRRGGPSHVRLDAADRGCEDAGEHHYLADLALLRRLVLGFDADAGDVNRAVAARPPVPAEPRSAAVARAREDEVLTAFADVCALSQTRPQDPEEWGDVARSPRDRFFDYLRAVETRGRGLPEGFLVSLRRALAHYGVQGLERTPVLEDALFRIFKAHQRVEHHVPAIMAILERRVDEADAEADDALRQLIERLEAATRHRFPALADLAGEARYRYFHQPAFERSRQRVYAEMERHLDHLAANPVAPDRAERIGLLVDCPQPMQGFLSERARAATAAFRALMLEVLLRRYYRRRQLEDMGTFDAGGRVWGTARYLEDGRPLRVVSTFGAYEDLERLARDAAALTSVRWEREHAVLDLQVWHPGPPADAELIAPEVLRAVAGAGRPVERVLVSVSGPGPGGRRARSHHLTFLRDAADGFTEERMYRGLHPMMAERLDLGRLVNFGIERLPSPEDVYLFHATARENSSDERLFAIAEVRDVTPVRDADGRVTGLPQLERMFLEAAAAIRREQARRPTAERLQWNRVMLHVWPPVTLRRDEIHSVVNRLAPATAGLGMEQTVVRVRMVDPRGGESRDTELHFSDPFGTGIVLMRFGAPSTRPLEPLATYRQKVVQMRRRGLVYPYEIVSLLTPAANGGDAPLPPGTFVEHDLDGRGRLVPVRREPGRNTANLVVGVVSSVTAKHPEGMARVIVLGDPSRDLGAVAEPECRRIIAALDLAERMAVPLEWFTLSSGARISMDSGTENMDWIAAVLRRLIEFTQAGGEVNLVVNGINVGAQPYWNAEATMLMHTRGILVMTPDGAMVLTGKQALDHSGGVSAEDNSGIGGYERIMGPNGQAQYWAPDLTSACRLLLRHYEHTYRAPGERFPRRATSTDPRQRDVRVHPHPPALGGLRHVGDVFSDESNPERKRAFDIRTVMAAAVDQDLAPMERWLGMRGAETAVVWDAHLGGYPVCLIGIESRPIPRHGPLPADGPEQWTAGTLFPLSSKKVARALNAASGNRPAVVLANLSGFDGSPESMRELQLEFGAEIGRAVVNFRGPIVFCVVSRYHGGAFVVFSNRLNDGLEVAAVEGSYASVIGGTPAAAVVFAREVKRRTQGDDRVQDLQRRLEAAGPGERAVLRAETAALVERVRSEKLGEVASEFDSVHSIERALEVGSVHRIISASELRPYLVDAVERGIRRELDTAAAAAQVR